MKIPAILLAFLFLTVRVSYCQLLSKPSLTVEDFENALTNTSQINKILKKHGFKYSSNGAKKFNPPGSIRNPLMPDVRTTLSEQWELKNKEDIVILKVNKYEWEVGHAPYPGVIKSVRLMVSRNSDFTDKLVEFLEMIKIRYPEKKPGYYAKIDEYVPSMEVDNIFTNDTNIEVQTGTTGQFYAVIFNLIK